MKWVYDPFVHCWIGQVDGVKVYLHQAYALVKIPGYSSILVWFDTNKAVSSVLVEFAEAFE